MIINLSFTSYFFLSFSLSKWNLADTSDGESHLILSDR